MPVNQPKSVVDGRTESEANAWMKQLKGLTITAASYNDDEGYMIELDHRIRIRSCRAHTEIFRRQIQ